MDKSDAGDVVINDVAETHIQDILNSGSPTKINDLITGLVTYSRSLRHLHKLNTADYETVEDKMLAFLEFGCEVFGQESGIINRVDDGICTVQQAFDQLNRFATGDTHPVTSTYCAAVMDTRQTVTYLHVGTIPEMHQHPMYEKMHYESYIATPIYINDAIYGTINFVSTQPRDIPFSLLQCEIIETMADYIGQSLEAKKEEQFRITAQDLLLEREHLLNLFARHSPAAIAMFDTEMCYILTSDEWRNSYGIPDDENIIGKNHYDVFPEIGDEWKAIHQYCLQGNVQRRDEDPFVREDGSITWIRWEIVPWYRGNDVGGIIMFTENITVRKQEQLKLKESQMLYRMMLEHLPDMCVMMFDRDLRYTLADGPLLETAGYSRDAMLGHTIYEVLPEASQQVLEPLYKRVLDGESISLERQTDDMYYDSRLTPVRDSDGAVFAGLITVQNVTSQMRAKMDLQQMNEQLLAANEDVQQFAYVVSHDLRAPLINLKGFSKIIEKNLLKLKAHIDGVTFDDHVTQELEVILGDKIPKSLGYISTSVDRLDTFTKAILELARIGSYNLEIQTVDTASLIGRIITSLDHDIQEKEIDVTTDNIQPIVGDETYIDQILGNLIVNAVQYTPAGGKGKIHIWMEEGRHFVTVHIQDNGRGIKEDDFNKVFQPFRRAGIQIVEGQGMGLAYVKAIVQRHGGKIWFTSKPDMGTTFSFTIPVMQIDRLG